MANGTHLVSPPCSAHPTGMWWDGAEGSVWLQPIAQVPWPVPVPFVQHPAAVSVAQTTVVVLSKCQALETGEN